MCPITEPHGERRFERCVLERRAQLRDLVEHHCPMQPPLVFSSEPDLGRHQIGDRSHPLGVTARLSIAGAQSGDQGQDVVPSDHLTSNHLTSGNLPTGFRGCRSRHGKEAADFTRRVLRAWLSRAGWVLHLETRAPA